MSLTAYNERIKLTATYINGVAIAVFAVGGFAPILGSLSASVPPSYSVTIFAVICFPLSFALHLGVRRLLADLKDADA